MINRIYIRPDGTFVGNYDGEALPDAAAAQPYRVDELIELPADLTPEHSDQIWHFPGWGPSLFVEKSREVIWRSEEAPDARNKVIAFQMGASDLPGTEQEWKDYWLGLYKWTEGNPDFPDSTKRPVAPNA